MYQNSLGMMPNVLNTDPILSVPNATGVPNINTVPNVLKMTNNDPLSAVFCHMAGLHLIDSILTCPGRTSLVLRN